jgi:ABC-type polysaccharide/polyol phosphate transport system ATPase subunit
MQNSSAVIQVEKLSRRFRVSHERPDSVRELFARFLKQKVEYHDFDAVRDVSFEIRNGEVVGIIGRNGSGKSTLLKMVAGVYKPSSGTVSVTGTVAPLLELGAGMHPELTGRENIILNGLMMGYSKSNMLKREQSIIDFADIGEFIDSPVKQYSSGMYMRLAFAVATEVDPQVLILDEVLSVGDAAFQAKCFKRMFEFREANKTILLVSHSLDTVSGLCTRVLVMEHGRLVYDGRPDDAIRVYNERSGSHEHQPEVVTV